MPRHTAAVQCLTLTLPTVLASAGLDGRVLLWDLTKPKFNTCGELKGHQRGVRHMAYSAQHKLLVTAGFEYAATTRPFSRRRPMPCAPDTAPATPSLPQNVY